MPCLRLLCYYRIINLLFINYVIGMYTVTYIPKTGQYGSFEAYLRLLTWQECGLQ